MQQQLGHLTVRTALVVVLSLLWLVEMASAQEPGGDSAAVDGTTRPENALVPLPVLFYQPETGTGFGAIGSYFLYRDAGPSARLVPSTLGLLAVYTTKRQFVAQLTTDVYLAGGRLRLVTSAGFSKFPTKFWGVGNETLESAEEEYTPQRSGLRGEFYYSFAPGWYAGAASEVTRRRLIEVTQGGLLDQQAVTGAVDGWLVGVGALVTRDTRDNSVNPRKGSYHQLGMMLFGSALRSDFDFRSVTLDLRTYVPLFATQTIALRAFGGQAFGAPPFDRLFELGGDKLLRGYFEGRFRDRSVLALQAELRSPVWWRVGVVGFAAVGQVASELTELEIGGFKPSLGAGIRFALSREAGLNIRADYGWALDLGSGGLYLHIGEAF